MSRRSPIPGTAESWLARAKGRLAVARLPVPEECFLEDWCSFCQQAAELSIKAVYQHYQWLFPYIHDLHKLLDGLETQGLGIPKAIRESGRLTLYYVQDRYPGICDPVTEDQCREAVEIAAGVVQWAEAIIATLPAAGDEASGTPPQGDSADG